MNISVKKGIILIASAYIVMVSPVFSGAETYKASNDDDPYAIEISDENEETQAVAEGDDNSFTGDAFAGDVFATDPEGEYAVEISDEKENAEEEKASPNNEDQPEKDEKPEDDEKKPLGKASGKEDGDNKYLSVSSSTSGVPFTVEVTGCSSKKAEDGAIRVIIDEEDSESESYYCSFNGGKTFKQMKGKTGVLRNIGAGSLSICVMKNNDRSTMSEVHTVMVYSVKSKDVIDICADHVSENMYKDGKIKVHINNYDREKVYEASVDGGSTWKEMSGSTAWFNYLNGGKYAVTVREQAEPSVSSQLNVTLGDSSHKMKNYIDADAVLQNPELPTGCEITSLTMLLNYIGYDADKVVMADKYLPKGEYRNADFNEVFVGDPKNYNAYGCFSKAIVKAAEDYISDQGDTDRWNIRNISGCTVEDLYSAVDHGCPAVVWGSQDMKPVRPGQSWTVKATGKQLTWPAGEHCMLFVGYNVSKGIIYVNDPMKGLAAYYTKDFEKVFQSLGSQAVIISEKEKTRTQK